MGTMNEFFFGRDVVSSKASYHLSQAIGLVNQNLQTAEALSNSNIAVVNFLVVQELLREAQPNAKIHMEGLQMMIELRGGISQLEAEDCILVLKLHK